MEHQKLTHYFQQSRKNDELVILEGFHALKHALRFDGEVLQSVSPDKAKLMELTEQLAPDLQAKIARLVHEISPADYKKLAPIPPRSGVISVAKRPRYVLNQLVPTGKIIVLDDPRDHQNVGAVIRASAAANAGGVLISGELDPWKPSVLRGSAGLHFALPVIQVSVQEIINLGRPIICFDERGTDMTQATLPNNSILVFGSERSGITQNLKDSAAQIVRIPMRESVSSLNLATSVAIALYQL